MLTGNRVTRLVDMHVDVDGDEGRSAPDPASRAPAAALEAGITRFDIAPSHGEERTDRPQGACRATRTVRASPVSGWRRRSGAWSWPERTSGRGRTSAAPTAPGGRTQVDDAPLRAQQGHRPGGHMLAIALL